MKIKTKKKFTLPQLIEWAWDNDDATGVRFQSDSFVTTVYFGKNGYVSVEDCSKKETFTVEVEEEITEDMVFNNLIHIYKDPENSIYTSSHENVSINDVKSEDYLKTTSVYVLNEDSTLTLVWTKEKDCYRW